MAYIIKHNNPSVGYISWQGLNMQYNGTSYPITNGNTNLIYSWWAINNPTKLQSSNTFPTLTAADALVLLNKNGTAILVPGSTVLDGSLVVPGSILADALSANSVTGEKILAGEIDTGHLKAGAITATTIAADAVGAEAIAAGIIVADHIASDAITSDKIVANAITTAKIATNAVTANEIASNAVTAGKIKAGEIDTGHLKAGAITATTIAADAVGAEAIAAGIIVAEHIHADAITSDKIVADAITTDKIAANAVTATEIAANSIIAAKIKAGEIDTVHIKAGAITTNKIDSTVGGSLDLSSNTAITSRVTKTEFEELDAEKASVTEIVNLWTNMSQAETAIIQLEDEISLLASKQEFDAVSDILSTLETSINVNTSAIDLKASQSDVDYINGLVSNHEAQLSVLSDKITLDFTSLDTQLEDVTSDIDAVKTFFEFSEEHLKIGKSTSPFNITISNDTMNFLDTGVITAYLTGQKFYVTQMEALQSFKVGVHIIEKHSNDITFVRWVG